MKEYKPDGGYKAKIRFLPNPESSGNLYQKYYHYLPESFKFNIEKKKKQETRRKKLRRILKDDIETQYLILCEDLLGI